LQTTIPTSKSYDTWSNPEIGSSGGSTNATSLSSSEDVRLMQACKHSLAALSYLLHELDTSVHGGNGLFVQRIQVQIPIPTIALIRKKAPRRVTLNNLVWSMQAGVQALGAVIEGCSFATNPEEVAQDVVMDNVGFNNSLAHSVALVIFSICFSSGAIVMFACRVPKVFVVESSFPLLFPSGEQKKTGRKFLGKF
jgi:hypothetical protein